VECGEPNQVIMLAAHSSIIARGSPCLARSLGEGPLSLVSPLCQGGARFTSAPAARDAELGNEAPCSIGLTRARDDGMSPSTVLQGDP
jgi:hypothetical protein